MLVIGYERPSVIATIRSLTATRAVSAGSGVA